MHKDITYKPFGDRAILIEWQPKIDENILKDMIQFKAKIKAQVDGVVDVILAYHSITILYKSIIYDFFEKVNDLKTIYLQKVKELEFKSNVWEIPVCYDLEFGLDLEEISKKKQLKIDDIIELHTKPLYTVFFIGFLPGFPYLSGLNQQLFFDRKANPRLKVEKGSVAIGGQQTGVYPVSSSGGWNIIGKTPISFFNINNSQPTFLKSGDKIKFVSISKEEFFKIEKFNHTAKIINND